MTQTPPSSFQPAPHGLAMVGLTVLSTATGGALVAVLNFIAQAKPLKPPATLPLLIGTGVLGLALFFAVCAAVAAYLSELKYSQAGNNRLHWWTAITLVLLAVLSLGMGSGFAFFGVVAQVT